VDACGHRLLVAVAGIESAITVPSTETGANPVAKPGSVLIRRVSNASDLRDIMVFSSAL
jgi:hypothetical protein